MDRAIILRAWDDQNKVMIYDFETFSDNNRIIAKEGTWSHNLQLTNKNRIRASLTLRKNGFYHTEHVKYLPTMQYTGIKDKNGTKIFEGDIIKFDTIFNKRGYFKKDRVIFENGGFFCNYCLISGYTTNTIEVIGNIYENLLEEN